MAIAPRGILVKAPKFNEPKYGLLNSVTPITPGDPHWMASGIEWEDDLCSDTLASFIDVCPPTSGFTKPAERGLSFCASDPFIVVGSFDCSTVGRPADEAFEIARRRLLAWEGRQVEATLWTGVSANGDVNPSFAFGNEECDIVPEDVNAAGALDPVAAISVLEDALADLIPGSGYIHVPANVIAFLKSHKMIVEADGGIWSPAGHRYVVGAGYPGTGPANAAPAAGQAWIFATGPLVLARSNVMMVPESVAEGVNRNINSITVRAERFYSVGFSCSLLAVRVLLTCDCPDIP